MQTMLFSSGARLTTSFGLWRRIFERCSHRQPSSVLFHHIVMRLAISRGVRRWIQTRRVVSFCFVNPNKCHTLNVAQSIQFILLLTAKWRNFVREMTCEFMAMKHGNKSPTSNVASGSPAWRCWSIFESNFWGRVFRKKITRCRCGWLSALLNSSHTTQEPNG